jgi:4-hydroxybenzoate polyprenyltransferase
MAPEAHSKSVHSSLEHLSKYIPPTKGVLSILPPQLVPYGQLMRIDKPTGIYLFYWPYLYGILQTSILRFPLPQIQQVLNTSLLFAAGTIFLRGAACSWNDTLDAPYDRLVARTRHRPVARGAVSPIAAHAFTILQSIIGSVILYQLPSACITYAVPTAVGLGIYPFMKRITYYPQVWLGLSMGWGVWVAAASMGADPFLWTRAHSIKHSTIIPLSCLYGAYTIWTIIYDTIYAHQDIKYDRAAGVKSMAVKFGHRTKSVLTTLTVVQIYLLVAAGWSAEMGVIYYCGTVFGTATTLGTMITMVDLEKPESCWWWFKNGCWYTGLAIASGLCGEYIWRLRGY